MPGLAPPSAALVEREIEIPPRLAAAGSMAGNRHPDPESGTWIREKWKRPDSACAWITARR